MKFARLWLIFVALAAGGLPLHSAAVEPSNRIESLQVGKAADRTVVKVVLQQALSATPAHFSIANPARLVFDLPGTGNALGYSAKAINEGGIRSLNVVQAGDRSRLVLNLDRTMRFESRQDGNALVITLIDDLPAPGEAPAMQRFAGSADPKASHGVRDIQFRRGRDGEGIIEVDLSSAETGVDVQQRGTKLEVFFRKSRLPENLRRQMDVVDFATPVTMISTRTVGEDVRMEITPKGLWEHVAFQSDNRFVITLKPVAEDPNKLFQGSKAGYQGEPISLNFQSIPLRELLHVFADITNFNIVLSDSVAGNVSLRLNDVPWDQALEIVLQQKNLAMRKRGNVVWIAPHDELMSKERLALESQQQIADLEPIRTEIFQLNYQKADAIQRLLSNKDQPVLSKRGSATFDVRTNKLFVLDTPTRLEEVRRLIKEIDVPVRQVLIEARIVEATDSFSRNLGARLGFGSRAQLLGGDPILRNGRTSWIGPSSFAVGGGLGAATGPNPTLAGNNADFRAANIASQGPAQISLVLFNNRLTNFLNLELSALEADGRGKIISSPRVMTADQVEALIEQGTEIPYQQASASGATAVQFRRANLALKVTPSITPDNRVMMKLEINKDSPNRDLLTGSGLAIDTKHVKTEVLVENGGTVVIGGIFLMEESNSTTRVPLLGDLPYVGFMFRKNEKVDKKTELLVFITPQIVNDRLTLR